MKKTILSLSLLLTIGSTYTFAQNRVALQPTIAVAAEATTQSMDVNPREAFLNISYKMAGGKMLVMADDHKEGPIFVENTSSTISEDTYKIYSVDGKTLIATYTVGRKANDIKMVMANGKETKGFVLGEYLDRATSDLEKDAVKRKVPVYWLYKNGYAK